MPTVKSLDGVERSLSETPPGMRCLDIAAIGGTKYLRPGEIFIVHTHPVVRSLECHVKMDLRGAKDTLEGALDWSDTLLCYDRTGLYNQPDSRSGVESFADASLAAHYGKIPFLRGDYITGYRHFNEETKRANWQNPFRPAS